MNNIQLKIDEQGKGAFVIEENGELLAEMAFSMAGEKMIIAHTEVSEKLAGKGVGKQLVGEMLTYVRANNLKVIPLCPFVHALFQRHPEDYADVWHRASAE